MQHPKMGTEKLRKLLSHHPDRMGRDRFYRLLREHGMLIKRTKRYFKTTDSNHVYHKYPNLLKERKVTAPMQVWVSDITYVKMGGKHAYLSLITDLYSKKIVGAIMAPNLEASHTIKALKQAIEREGAPEMHHSDRGIQYCCYEYTQVLQKHGIRISMTQTGDPLDNAVAERVNGIIKNEYIYPYFKIKSSSTDVLDQALEAYNQYRPHRTLKMETPEKVHAMSTYKRKIKKRKLLSVN